MSYTNNQIDKEANLTNTFNVWSFISRCIKRWWLILITLVLSYYLADFYWGYQVPQFRVTGKVLIEDPERNQLSNVSIFQDRSNLFSERLNLVNEIELIKSQKVIERAIRELNLNVRFYEKGRFVDDEFFGDRQIPVKISFLDSIEHFYETEFKITPKSQDQYLIEMVRYNDAGAVAYTETDSSSFGKIMTFDDRKFLLSRNGDKPALENDIIIYTASPSALTGQYMGRLSLSAIEQSDVLDISFEDNHPERSIQLINKLIEVYNLEVLENKNLSNTKTLDFIDERLNFITQELNEVEDDLERFKQNTDIPVELSKGAELLIAEVSESDRQLAQLDIQKDILQMIDSVLRDPAASQELIAVNIQVGNQTLSLVQDYNDLVLQRKSMLLSATEENPSVRLLDEQISTVRGNVLAWVSFKEAEVNKQRNSILSKVSPLDAQINAIPTYERELLQIIRQQAVKEALFTFLLQKREESAIRIASEVNQARIINEPIKESRVSAGRVRVFIIFIFVGLMLPVGFLFLREFFDNKIHSKKDLSELTDAPFLGEVMFAGLSKTRRFFNLVGRKLGFTKSNPDSAPETTGLLVAPGSRKVIAEMFRLIMTNLQFLSKGQPYKKILVTSSISGEGKTFISINLAATMSFTDKKVVVLGMDLRKPKFQEYLGEAASGKGVTNYLIGEENDLDKLIHNVPGNPNLFIIPSGPIPPNPHELILGERTAQLFEELEEKCDCIIVDSPPVGLVADSLCLEKHVNTTLYVTRFEYTDRNHIKIVDEIYNEKKLPNVAILLNGIKKRVGSRYGYGYSYGYGYYSDDRKWWQKLLPFR